MSKSSSSTRTKLIAAVHTEAKKIGLEKEDYREFLRAATGKTSAADCTEAELLRVRDRMRGGDGRRQAADPIPTKIRVMCRDLHELGGWPDPDLTEAGIARFCRRQAGVDDAGWVQPDRVSSVVEALRARLKRVGCDLPPNVKPDDALRIVLDAQEDRLYALHGRGMPAEEEQRLQAVRARIATGGLGRSEMWAMVSQNGARIRALVAARKEGGADD